MPARPIFVEITIRCGAQGLWDRTQRPEMHQRRDVFGALFGYRGRFGIEPRRLTRREVARVIPRRQELRE